MNKKTAGSMKPLSLKAVTVFTACSVFLAVCLAGNVHGADINTNARMADIKSKNPKVRAGAVCELGKHRKTESRGEMLSALKAEKDDSVRVQMVHSLGSMGGRDAAAEISGLAKNDGSKDIRSASCLNLGILGDKAYVPVLKEVLGNENEDENVRISAASSLTFFLGEQGVKETLEKIIRGQNTVVKFGLVNSLRHTTKSSVGKYLLNISVKDPDQDISSLSRELLEVK